MKILYTLLLTLVSLLGIIYQAAAESLQSTNSELFIASESALISLEKIFPDALKQENPKIFVFCPDSTCIEFVNKNNFQSPALAIIYLFYEGDYYDLAKWRISDEVENNVHTILNALNLNRCVDEKDVNHSCLKSEFRRAGIKVRNVRYDEGHKFVRRVW